MGSLGNSTTLRPDLNNLIDLLRYAAHQTSGSIVSYSATKTEPGDAERVSYRQLWDLAQVNAEVLTTGSANHRVAPKSIVLIHLDKSLDAIIWFWSTILAGAVPVITSPTTLSNSPAERRKHLEHLYRVLDAPLCLTRQGLLEPFSDQSPEAVIETLCIEDLSKAVKRAAINKSQGDGLVPLPVAVASDVAALMLTSGSSGNAKAVKLAHGQVLAAIAGKAAFVTPHPSRPYLSWIGMDHVANLTEIHLQAMYLGLDQVQVSALDILAEPFILLNLIHRHRVQRLLALNFFLARLRRALDSGNTSSLDKNLDLQCLTFVISGGEATAVEVVTGLQARLEQYGAPRDFIVSAFGMTETCAGCVYNTSCPTYDRKRGLEFAAVGTCIQGARMRITSGGTVLGPGERGDLELSGEVITTGYHNNEAATRESFTADGWFRTGDLAYIDDEGFLTLSGRSKEVLIVNGIKYPPHEIESALEEAQIPGATPSYFCCFSTLDASFDTERVVIAYLPRFDATDDVARAETQSSIVRTVSMHTLARPVVLPLTTRALQKSSLGKLARAKVKTAFERGEYATEQAANDLAVARHRLGTRGEPESDEEAAVLEEMRRVLDLPADDDFSINDSVLAMGATSIELIAIVQCIKKRLAMPKPLPIIDVLNNPTPRGLTKCAVRLRGTKDGAANTDANKAYDPVVCLQPFGNKRPLWLIHPGVGEVLAFLNLAKHLTDRPVYGFRARGFNSGETFFTTLDEMLNSYMGRMREVQPHGPYAVAGYSFGGMVAFEMAKRLEAAGEEVRYLGIWNLPPHVRTRLQELDWAMCIVLLFYFISLQPQDVAMEQLATVRMLADTTGNKAAAVAHMRGLSDQARWDELGLHEADYVHWADLATSLQGVGRHFEPAGIVATMDVFVANPLKHTAPSRAAWRELLEPWNDHVRAGGLHFHDVDGEHYTMISPAYVVGFAQRLRKILAERGI